MKSTKPFELSLERFYNHPFYNELVGYCNWEIIQKNTMFQHWNHKEHGPVIIQFYRNGGGFQTYKAF